MKRLTACLLLVALAGCAAPVADDGGAGGELGEVDNVTARADLTVSAEDGLTRSDLERLTKRTMARIELIRGLDYNQTVDVEVISRSEYRNRSVTVLGGGTSAERNVFWEALFVIGEDRDAGEVLDEASGSAVQGYYSSFSEEIVIVSDAEQPTVHTPTLVHELVHVLQDQHFGLGANTSTHDERQGYLGTIEGEAQHVPAAYFARCDVQWTCLDLPSESAAGTRTHPGVDLVIVQPYVSGPEFVADVRQRQGWAGVDRLHERYPDSSAQVIHPGRYPEAGATAVNHTDRSGPDWSRVNGPKAGETVGEGAIFAMLAHNDAIAIEGRLTYEHPFTSGWAGDMLVPYETDDGSLGYVWTTEWQTEKDASQFLHAYREILENRDATERGGDAYTVSDGSFADAFRVTQDGTTVRIVNAPSVEELAAVHPPE